MALTPLFRSSHLYQLGVFPSWKVGCKELELWGQTGSNAGSVLDVLPDLSGPRFPYLENGLMIVAVAEL